MEEAQLSLEEQIQSLLCAELCEADRSSLLMRIARDDDARALLAEMLEVQQQARSAFGYDDSTEAMQASLGAVIGSLPSVGRGRAARRLGVAWLVAAAALALVAVSAYLAISTERRNRQLQARLDDIHKAVGMSKITAGELSQYRRIWESVAGPAGQARPWILLRDGRGEFGYMPATPDVAGGGRLVLLRCKVVGANGRGMEEVNLLLPARRGARLSLPEAGRLAGAPLRCDVVAGKEWTAVGLAVEDEGGAAGVSGRARAGGGPVEIGRFQFRGEGHRVFVQLVPVG